MAKIDIVVISLFNGLSAGRVALDRVKHLNVLRYYSSEIEKHAIRVADENYPQDIPYKLGSVIDIDGHSLLSEIRKEFGDVKILLIGGTPCFVAGTKVITRDAYKNIEDVKIGDFVLTHTGEYKRVLDIGCKMSKTLIVKAQGIKPTETTCKHPYYVRSMSRKWNNEKRRDERVFSEPYWKEAQDLMKGDFIGVPINDLAENPLNLTSEECYILGRYIADGHTRKDYRTTENRPNDRQWQLILSVGLNKVSKFTNNISDNHYSSYRHGKSVQRIVFSNKRLVEIAEKYCGISAINKIIHQVFINLPTELLVKVLDGYMDGDGSHRDGVYKAISISEQLIMTLSQVVAKVYRTNSSYEYTKKPKTTVIEGRTVNQNDAFGTTFRKEMKKQSKARVIDDIIWLPFKESLDTKKESLVFNMEVENDNSYTANNAIVHNCSGFSMAGKLRGSATKCGQDVVSLDQYSDLKEKGFEFDGQSYLFWEYVRLKQEINPDYFMLENVKITKKWLPMFNETMGVEPIVIDSKLVSFQGRVRFYWHNLGDIPQPSDEKIYLKDNYCHEYDDSLVLKGRGLNKLSRPRNRAKSVLIEKCPTILREQCSKATDALVFYMPDGTPRYPTRREMELMQTLPVGYTDCVSYNNAAMVIGNGWTVKVIAHILGSLAE